ncbi:hypothetical protein ACFQ2M_29040 [Kitasatospora saccharophila]
MTSITRRWRSVRPASSVRMPGGRPGRERTTGAGAPGGVSSIG